MNILMLTNTYLPHVGGVARSVDAFATAFRERGHRVLIVAPQFEDVPEHEHNIVRVPAFLDLMGSGFSLPLPVPGILTDALDAFRPDIVHSHHPYLLGMTALRIARSHGLPLIFTHHTLYEAYTHYIAADLAPVRRFVSELATAYANLCDQVVAPSESLADLLRRRGVETPIEIIPTGVADNVFRSGDGGAFRKARGIPPDAFVIGHLGRLAPEKNVEFLSRAVARCLVLRPQMWFLVAGDGTSAEAMEEILDISGVSDRVTFAGVVEGNDLMDAYHAMDAFAFGSLSETQGMVLTEAMACGVPVVALDGPGVREVVRDGWNGRLLATEDEEQFAAALASIHDCSPAERQRMIQRARETASAFSLDRTATQALDLYGSLLRSAKPTNKASTQWNLFCNLLKVEWDMTKGLAEAARYGFRFRPDEHGLH